MRAVTLVSLLAYTVYACEPDCPTTNNAEHVIEQREAPASRPNILGSSRFWGKRAFSEELRRASIRWGKRSQPDYVRKLLQSSARWGKRDGSDINMNGKLRKASRLWGKRSYDYQDVLPAAGIIMPVPIEDEQFPSLVVPEEPIMVMKPEGALERVTKADHLRPKLAKSSILWGRR